jgi:hypothetical protein
MHPWLRNEPRIYRDIQRCNNCHWWKHNRKLPALFAGGNKEAENYSVWSAEIMESRQTFSGAPDCCGGLTDNS